MTARTSRSEDDRARFGRDPDPWGRDEPQRWRLVRTPFGVVELWDPPPPALVEDARRDVEEDG